MSRNDVVYPRSMVVAAQPEAVEAGVDMFHLGGNAVDAAIACALVAGVVDPQMCGIAGFGNVQVRLPGAGVHRCIDFHGTSPAGTRPDQWEHLVEGETRDGFGFIVRGAVNDVGYGSITTPGAMRAYHEAQTTWGVLDWADVVAPAIACAETGFLVRPHMHSFWTEGATLGRAHTVDRLGFSEAGRRMYFRSDGTLKGIGDVIVNPDLADSLRLIARDGADAFYTGEIAERIVADMEAHGAVLSGDDLAAYQTTHNDPIRRRYRGRDVFTNHPPGGGVMLLEMLGILEHFDLAAMGHNTVEYVRTVTEAMKWATIDKDTYVGDPDFVDVPVDVLLSDEHLADLALRIASGARAKVERLGEPPDTTHVSVVDAEGNAVTMTHSLGMPSGVIPEGLGFMLNGCMGVFDPRPGRAGSLAPGKRRFTSLCPTIVTGEDGELELVLGAPGGTQIAMGVLQTMLNSIDFDMSIGEAVAAPRVSGTSTAIDVCNRVPHRVTAELEADGYDVIRDPHSYAFARVHAIEVVGGDLRGAADPGGDGSTMDVPA